VGVIAVRDAGRAGETAASQPRVLAARSCAQPPRERSGRQTPQALTTTPLRFGRASWPIIRIAISAETFGAIAPTLSFGNVSYENKTNEQGQRLIWLDRAMVDRLRAMRGPGESYTGVILRLAGRDGAHDAELTKLPCPSALCRLNSVAPIPFPERW
jgi:hypothetical protein